MAGGIATMSERAPAVTETRAAVRRIEIRDFRNLHRVDADLPADGLALVGENGQGKTNLLEALYYVQLLRSFRGTRDIDLVTFGAPGFHLHADLDGARARAIDVGFERAGRRKRVRVDGLETERLGDALGIVPIALFSPHDGEIVAGAPSERRRFLDVMLALGSRAYLTALQRYRAALAHRNAALRAPAARADRVAVWEPALAESGAVLWRERRAWVDEHAARYASLCEAIGERGAARMQYRSVVDASGALADALRDALERDRDRDLRRGLTHAGPHRDELSLTLDDRELRVYGSAGQQRTAAIALRLLESATRRRDAEREPIVLLDDPFAELDARRAARILELLNAQGRGQTILAVPREDDIPAGLTRLARWRIAAGELAVS